MAIRIHEPIAVTASFQHGHVRPVQFFWRNRSLPVDTVSFMWRSTEGATHLVHFSVLSGRTLYELVFDTRAFRWRLEQVEAQEGRS